MPKVEGGRDTEPTVPFARLTLPVAAPGKNLVVVRAYWALDQSCGS